MIKNNEFLVDHATELKKKKLNQKNNKKLTKTLKRKSNSN